MNEMAHPGAKSCRQVCLRAHRKVKTAGWRRFTQIGPGGGTCKITRIVTKSNKTANEPARQAADKTTGRFDWSREPVTIGNILAEAGIPV
ncbi:hypothetical protein ACFFVJ_11645 [Roseibium salinum]